MEVRWKLVRRGRVEKLGRLWRDSMEAADMSVIREVMEGNCELAKR